MLKRIISSSTNTYVVPSNKQRLGYKLIALAFGKFGEGFMGKS